METSNRKKSMSQHLTPPQVSKPQSPFIQHKPRTCVSTQSDMYDMAEKNAHRRLSRSTILIRSSPPERDGNVTGTERSTERTRIGGASQEAEIDAVIGAGVTSLARLAFAASPPGTTPTDEQVTSLFGGTVVPNVGTLASLKRLVFEAQTLVVADVKSKVTKKDDVIPANMAPAERENRINEQRKRLSGLRLRGEEEVVHGVYDMLLAMAEKDVISIMPQNASIREDRSCSTRSPTKSLRSMPRS